MDWTLLKIAPTDDKNAISAAYRERLKDTNPEDRPEEFKALRAAYEEAMRLAASGAVTPVRDESPVGKWMEKVAAVYDDFAARITPACWRELLRDEVCLALDWRPEAEERLFRFLMDHWYLPQNVWKLLVEAFSVRERLEEFYGAYSRDFIDYAVLAGADNPSGLPYEYFLPGNSGADCDRYRKLYANATNTSDPEERNKLMDEMEALSETHPYGQAMRLRTLLGTEREDVARRGIRELADRYPDDSMLVMLWTNICLAAGDNEEAERRSRRLLEKTPEDRAAAMALAECVYRKGEVLEAKEMIYALARHLANNHPLHNTLSRTLQEWNEGLIAQLESVENKSVKERMELAWAYVQNDRKEEAAQICDGLEPDETTDLYDYHNLMGKTYIHNDRPGDALEHLRRITGYLSAPDAGETVPADRLERLGEFLALESDCLRALNRMEESDETLRRAAEADPENEEVLLRIGNDYYIKNDNVKALEYFERAVAVAPESPTGRYCCARALYELYRDRDAFENINGAIERNAGRLEYYTLKLDILLRNQAWDAAREIMDLLKENGLDSLAQYAWYEARFAEEEQKDEAAALQKLLDIEKRLEAGEWVERPAEFYHRLCLLAGKDMDAKKPEDNARLTAWVDKGIESNPHHIPCLYYKAWLLKNGGKTDEALTLYHQLEGYPNHSLSIERAIADLYYQDLDRNAAKALHYYQILEKANPDDDVLCFYLGCCYRTLGEYDKAKAAFRREMELEPEDADGYRGMSIVLEYEKKYEEALEYLEQVIPLAPNEDRRSEYYYRKHRLLRRLGRPWQAVEALDEANRHSDRYHIFRAKFGVFAAFGMWSEAKKLLAEWKKTGSDEQARLDREIRLAMLTGSVARARVLLFENGKKLMSGDLEDRKRELDEYDGKYKPQLRHWENKLKENGDSSHALNNLALVYGRMGETEKMRENAQKALELLDEQVLTEKSDEPMYRARRAMALAMCGRMEEARRELALARELHLCDHCAERYCKDADIFELHMEELFGDKERAKEIARAGLEKCPDEMDFITAIQELNRKG